MPFYTIHATTTAQSHVLNSNLSMGQLREITICKCKPPINAGTGGVYVARIAITPNLIATSKAYRYTRQQSNKKKSRTNHNGVNYFQYISLAQISALTKYLNL